MRKRVLNVKSRSFGSEVRGYCCTPLIPEDQAEAASLKLIPALAEFGLNPSRPCAPLPTDTLPDETQENEAGVRKGDETGENCPLPPLVPPPPLLD